MEAPNGQAALQAIDTFFAL
jgi:hypothetical protein